MPINKSAFAISFFYLQIHNLKIKMKKWS